MQEIPEHSNLMGMVVAALWLRLWILVDGLSWLVLHLWLVLAPAVASLQPFAGHALSLLHAALMADGFELSVLEFSVAALA